MTTKNKQLKQQIPGGNDRKKGKGKGKYNSRSLRDDSQKGKGKGKYNSRSLRDDSQKGKGKDEGVLVARN